MDEIIKCPHCGMKDEHTRTLVEEFDYDIDSVQATVRYKCVLCAKDFFVTEVFDFSHIGRVRK